MLWRASIDDSADKNREKVIISALLLGDSEQWRTLVRPLKVLLAENGMEYFKSSECGRLDGQFRQFRNELKYPKPKGREAADGIRDELDQIIKRSEVVGLGVIVPVAVFNTVYAEPQYAAILSSHDPYKWAIQILWGECVKGMRELGRNHIVTFAHDDGENYDRLRRLFIDYKAKNPNLAQRMADLYRWTIRSTPRYRPQM